MTFMTRICHLRIILHYVLKLDCDTAIAIQEDVASLQSFSTSDLEATLTLLDPQNILHLQNIYVRFGQNRSTRSGVMQ